MKWKEINELEFIVPVVYQSNLTFSWFCSAEPLLLHWGKNFFQVLCPILPQRQGLLHQQLICFFHSGLLGEASTSSQLGPSFWFRDLGWSSYPSGSSFFQESQHWTSFLLTQPRINNCSTHSHNFTCLSNHSILHILFSPLLFSLSLSNI